MKILIIVVVRSFSVFFYSGNNLIKQSRVFLGVTNHIPHYLLLGLARLNVVDTLVTALE